MTKWMMRGDQGGWQALKRMVLKAKEQYSLQADPNFFKALSVATYEITTSLAVPDDDRREIVGPLIRLASGAGDVRLEQKCVRSLQTTSESSETDEGVCIEKFQAQLTDVLNQGARTIPAILVTSARLLWDAAKAFLKILHDTFEKGIEALNAFWEDKFVPLAATLSTSLDALHSY